MVAGNRDCNDSDEKVAIGGVLAGAQPLPLQALVSGEAAFLHVHAIKTRLHVSLHPEKRACSSRVRCPGLCTTLTLSA